MAHCPGPYLGPLNASRMNTRGSSHSRRKQGASNHDEAQQEECPEEDLGRTPAAGEVRHHHGGRRPALFLLAAQRDISRRPAEQIRGSKALWRVATLVNFIGPASYFTFGVKRHPAAR